MTYEDYMVHFTTTEFCVTLLEYPPKQQIILKQVSAGYFEITLKEDIDTSEKIFAISACQLGDRLAGVGRSENKLTISNVYISLYTGDGTERIKVEK